jgi:hypothetical protein
MKLFSYYKKAVIYPSLFTVFFCIIYSILDNYIYKSEWLTFKSLIISAVISSFIFCLLMYGLSLTIFLNKFNKLNKNLIWNLFTWFLLPLGYITMVFIQDIGNRIKFSFGFGKDFIFLLIVTIPFVVGLCWTFLEYRKKITTMSTQ